MTAKKKQSSRPPVAWKRTLELENCQLRKGMENAEVLAAKLADSVRAECVLQTEVKRAKITENLWRSRAEDISRKREAEKFRAEFFKARRDELLKDVLKESEKRYAAERARDYWKHANIGTIILLVILLALLLSGCASAPETPPALNIYSPLVLTVEPGTPIQTVDGVYTPQVRETWWSDKEYRELNDKYIELLGKQSK